MTGRSRLIWVALIICGLLTVTAFVFRRELALRLGFEQTMCRGMSNREIIRWASRGTKASTGARPEVRQGDSEDVQDVIYRDSSGKMTAGARVYDDCSIETMKTDPFL